VLWVLWIVCLSVWSDGDELSCGELVGVFADWLVCGAPWRWGFEEGLWGVVEGVAGRCGGVESFVERLCGRGILRWVACCVGG